MSGAGSSEGHGLQNELCIGDGARVAKDTLSCLDSSVNPQEPGFQVSLLEPNTSQADVCETDVQELSFATIQDHGYQSEYTMDEGDQYLFEAAHKIGKDTQDFPDSSRGAAMAEDPKSLSACDILDPNTGVLDSVDLQGLPVRTWDPAAADDTDPAHTSDGDDAGFDGLNVNQKENVMTLDSPEDAYEIVCKLELCGLQTTESQESLVPTEGTDGMFAEDVLEPDAGDLVYDQDVPENTESPALGYMTDTVTTRDLCEADDAALENVNPEDTPPERPAPVDFCVGYDCMSEADLLEGADNRDTVCADRPVPVDDPETVCGGDVCDPEACVLEGENNEDLPVSVQHAGSPDTLDRRDANETEAEGRVEDLELDLHTKSPAAAGDVSEACVEEDVYDPEADVHEGAGSQDLDTHTESLVPADDVDDVFVDAGVRDPEADLLEGSDNEDLSVFTEGSSSEAAMYNVEKRDEDQAEAGDLVVDLDRHTRAETRAPVDEDRIYVVDVCEPEAYSLAESVDESAASMDAVERCDAGDPEDDLDLHVYSEIPAPAEFRDGNVEDDCNKEAGDLEGDEQDLPESSVLVDDMENVDTCDVCECEDPIPVDTDNLQTTVCAPDCKLEQDPPRCLENDGSEVGPGTLYVSDVHEAGAPESRDYECVYDPSLGLPVHSVTPAAAGDTGRRYTEAVDLESGDSQGTSWSEQAASQDLPVSPDGSVPASDTTCTRDADEGKPVEGPSSSDHSPVADTVQ